MYVYLTTYITTYVWLLTKIVSDSIGVCSNICVMDAVGSHHSEIITQACQHTEYWTVKLDIKIYVPSTNNPDISDSLFVDRRCLCS